MSTTSKSARSLSILGRSRFTVVPGIVCKKSVRQEIAFEPRELSDGQRRADCV